MEKANPEAMKWPTNKTAYDRYYDKIFPPCICGGFGYLMDWSDIQKKYLKTTCLLCGGGGRRKI